MAVSFNPLTKGVRKGGLGIYSHVVFHTQQEGATDSVMAAKSITFNDLAFNTCKAIKFFNDAWGKHHLDRPRSCKSQRHH